MDQNLDEFLNLVWHKRRQLKPLNPAKRASKIYGLYSSAGNRYKKDSRARQMVEIVKAAYEALRNGRGQCRLQLQPQSKEEELAIG